MDSTDLVLVVGPVCGFRPKNILNGRLYQTYVYVGDPVPSNKVIYVFSFQKKSTDYVVEVSSDWFELVWSSMFVIRSNKKV